VFVHMIAQGEGPLGGLVGGGNVWGGGGHAEREHNKLSRIDGLKRRDKQPRSLALINLIPSVFRHSLFTAACLPFSLLFYVPIIDNHTPFSFLAIIST
jgi:hypothetical protein